MREGKKVEFAKKFLNEGKEYISKGDPVQASEKLYKASEEAVKSLVKSFELSEDKEAEKKAGGLHLFFSVR